jgi:hypothetical protein
VDKIKEMKRKAIDCKLIRKSNSNPGYFKYEVTIQEKDGTTQVQPAYGTCMQSALSRLIKKEITERAFQPGLVGIAWCVLMGWPLIVFPGIEESPMYLVYSMGSIVLAGFLTYLWIKHINKT